MLELRLEIFTSDKNLPLFTIWCDMFVCSVLLFLLIWFVFSFFLYLSFLWNLFFCFYVRPKIVKIAFKKKKFTLTIRAASEVYIYSFAMYYSVSN